MPGTSVPGIFFWKRTPDTDFAAAAREARPRGRAVPLLRQISRTSKPPTWQ